MDWFSLGSHCSLASALTCFSSSGASKTRPSRNAKMTREKLNDGARKRHRQRFTGSERQGLGKCAHKTFNSILAASTGPDYAIAKKWVVQITSGMKVVVFNRAEQKQAEGVVSGLTPTGNKTGQGLVRYDVLIRGLIKVSYTHPPQVDRFGVAVV